MCRKRESHKRSRSASGRRSCSNLKRRKTLPHLDSAILQIIFSHCEGISRLQFGAVCKLWRDTRIENAVHDVRGDAQLQAAVQVCSLTRLAISSAPLHSCRQTPTCRAVKNQMPPQGRPCAQAAKPYDTIVLHPGLYKQRVLGATPMKLISSSLYNPLQSCPKPPAAACGASPQAWQSGPGALSPALSSSAVTLWQERPPVVLSNSDTMCLVGVTIRVAHASHEYSSVAYGSDGRSITLECCQLMGGTGLRVPFSVDPLRILLLNLRGCVIQVRTVELAAMCPADLMVRSQRICYACTGHPRGPLRRDSSEWPAQHGPLLCA